MIGSKVRRRTTGVAASIGDRCSHGWLRVIDCYRDDDVYRIVGSTTSTSGPAGTTPASFAVPGAESGCPSLGTSAALQDQRRQAFT